MLILLQEIPFVRAYGLPARLFNVGPDATPSHATATAWQVLDDNAAGKVLLVQHTGLRWGSLASCDTDRSQVQVDLENPTVGARCRQWLREQGVRPPEPEKGGGALHVALLEAHGRLTRPRQHYTGRIHTDWNR